MSYYKLKYASINKKNKTITLTVADSSVRPLYYFKSPYGKEGESFEESLEAFVVSMLNGNIQGGQSKIHSIMHFLESVIKSEVTETSFENDMKYTRSLTRLNGLYHLLAREIGVPYLLGEDIGKTQDKWMQDIKNFEAESKAIYEKKQKEFDEQEIMPVRSAYSSDVFPELIVLALRDDDSKLALCDKACYTHLGLLESKAGKCVFVPNRNGLFYVLGYGGYGEIADGVIKDEVFENIRTITDTIGRLPYANFDLAKYGFKVVEKEVA